MRFHTVIACPARFFYVLGNNSYVCAFVRVTDWYFNQWQLQCNKCLICVCLSAQMWAVLAGDRVKGIWWFNSRTCCHRTVCRLQNTNFSTCQGIFTVSFITLQDFYFVGFIFVELLVYVYYSCTVFSVYGFIY